MVSRSISGVYRHCPRAFSFCHLACLSSFVTRLAPGFLQQIHSADTEEVQQVATSAGAPVR